MRVFELSTPLVYFLLLSEKLSKNAPGEGQRGYDRSQHKKEHSYIKNQADGFILSPVFYLPSPPHQAGYINTANTNFEEKNNCKPSTLGDWLICFPHPR